MHGFPGQLFGAERLLVLCTEGSGCGCALFSSVSLVGTEITDCLCSHCAAVSSALPQLGSLALPHLFCAASFCFYYLHTRVFQSLAGDACPSSFVPLALSVFCLLFGSRSCWNGSSGTGELDQAQPLCGLTCSRWKGAGLGWRLRASPSPWLASCTERSRLSLWLRQKLPYSACGHVFPAPRLFSPGQGPRRSVPMTGLSQT